VIVRVDFVYQLSVEVYQLFEFLLQQASHALFFTFFGLVLALPRPHTQIGVNWVSGIQLKCAVRFLASEAAIFASTNFLDIGASPRITGLESINNVLFIDERETVKTKFLLTGSRLIIAVALIDQPPFDLTHVASSNFHERNGWAFIERQLLYPLIWISFIKVRLFLIFPHYFRDLIHLINIWNKCLDFTI